MAELILTDEEKAAETWLELPDDVVGKLTKYSAARLHRECKDRDKVWHLACALMLIDFVRRSGSVRLEQVIEDCSLDGEAVGDWKITVEKISNSRQVVH